MFPSEPEKFLMQSQQPRFGDVLHLNAGFLIISLSYLLIGVVRVVVVVVVVQDGRTLLGVHAFLLLLFFMVFSLIQSLLHLFLPSVVIHTHKAGPLKQKNYRTRLAESGL